jgi:hypothetical protein
LIPEKQALRTCLPRVSLSMRRASVSAMPEPPRKDIVADGGVFGDGLPEPKKTLRLDSGTFGDGLPESPRESEDLEDVIAELREKTARGEEENAGLRSENADFRARLEEVRRLAESACESGRTNADRLAALETIRSAMTAVEMGSRGGDQSRRSRQEAEQDLQDRMALVAAQMRKADPRASDKDILAQAMRECRRLHIAHPGARQMGRILARLVASGRAPKKEKMSSSAS